MWSYIASSWPWQQPSTATFIVYGFNDGLTLYLLYFLVRIEELIAVEFCKDLGIAVKARENRR